MSLTNWFLITLISLHISPSGVTVIHASLLLSFLYAVDFIIVGVIYICGWFLWTKHLTGRPKAERCRTSQWWASHLETLHGSTSLPQQNKTNSWWRKMSMSSRLDRSEQSSTSIWPQVEENWEQLWVMVNATFIMIHMTLWAKLLITC